MATLPRSRGRPRRATGNDALPPKAKPASASTLPSWCLKLRKESVDSERAYDERVTTSTKTSEIRLRQECIRYWNRFLEEAEVVAFDKITAPTCRKIKDILSGDFGGDNDEASGEKQKHCIDDKIEKKGDGDDRGMEDKWMDQSVEKKHTATGGDDNTIINAETLKSDDGGDWEYCQQMFGLPSASTSALPSKPTTTNQEGATETTSKNSAAMTSNEIPARIRYPFEVLPIFVITSPLVSNCMQDRSKICHSMWRQFNALESTTGNLDNLSVNNKEQDDSEIICLYLPRLLSSLTETLQVLWDGLLCHYENTHDAPSMDTDDPHYYSNPNDLDSKRHSYHASKRRHYEALIDRKVTTESQKSKIGTKKQQSLQDFILEFLQFIYEEPEDFLEQERQDQKAENSASFNQKTEGRSTRAKGHRPRRGNLILLLEDPRIIHQKVAINTGQGMASGSGSKPNSSNLVQGQLLETLAVWREMHGIPISLVVFHSVGSKHEIQQNNAILNPSFESSVNGGRFGIQITRCSIPSVAGTSFGTSIPASMAYGLWSHYFLQATMDNPLPLLAPQRCHSDQSSKCTITEIVLRMSRDAFQSESSCSKWVSSIRARIASNFYTQKGSFVWDALNPNTACMMRNFSLSSERATENSRNIENDSNINNSNGIDKDRNAFEAGNDDVQIFQPEFVAWFCSYRKANNLLSSQAGGRKADMTLREKHDALLKCYQLKRPPIKSNAEIKCPEKPLKRQKLSNGEYPTENCNTCGSLQFWWSISCSLLPLYFLSITVAKEGLILSSLDGAQSRYAVNGSSKRRNDSLLEGESGWVLELLAKVYKQLSTILDERDVCGTNVESETTMSNMVGVGVQAKVKMITESGEPEQPPTRYGHTRDTISNKFIKGSLESARGSRNEHGRDLDFVETTLKRYLRRGITELSGDGIDNYESHTVCGGATAFQKLKIMVQELIVLVASFSFDQNQSEKEDDVMIDDKIRLGVAETILEMNLLALSQVEASTLRWVESNPLMGHVYSEDFRSNDNNNELCNEDNLSVNFRRRILENLPAGSRHLYEAMEGRLSIDRDEWYNLFDGTIEDFILGVWTLKMCGLIRPKKTIIAQKQGKSKKRQEVISYEKVAVVWC